MNRKQREISRKNYESSQQHRRNRAEQAAQTSLAKEVEIQGAFQKRPREEGVVLDPFLLTIKKKAPKLLGLPHLKWLARQVHVRDVASWTPKGKSATTMLRSLLDHMLAKYPVPAMFWSALDYADAELDRSALNFVLHAANGGSMYAYVKDGHFPVPLTRKMCHELMTISADYSFVSAVRYVQVRAAGGDRRLFNVWMSTRYAQRFGSREVETFWFSVLEWLARQPMLNPSVLGPVCDYINHCRAADPKYSLKGRTGVSVVRAMEEWHKTLATSKRVKKATYQPSGFQEAMFNDLSRHENGRTIKEVWRVRELLTEKSLYEEGRRMSHCVWSYSSYIERGEVSIWSVQMEDGQGETGNWAMVTVEVRNQTKTIVQARGKCNRSMTSKEMQVVNRWANLNELKISLGRW